MKEIKNLKYCTFVILILLVLIVFFVIAFFSNKLPYFIVCVVLLVLFLVSCAFCLKTITSQKGYTVLQALSFYLRCKKECISKKDIDNKANVLTILQRFTNDCDFAKSFQKNDYIRFYLDGKSVYQYLNNSKTGNMIIKIMERAG